MIKLLHFMFTLLLSENDIFSPRRSDHPVRLEKRKKSITFCERIAPYVLFIALVLLGVLTVIVLVKYGANITGTEANHYYNGQWR